jgi:hypothetical protein
VGIKSLITVVVWIVALLLGFNATRITVSRWSLAAGSKERPKDVGGSNEPMNVTPYTVMFDLSRPNKPEAKARAAVGAVKIVALRADGSLMQQLENFDGLTPISSRLIQLASGTVITTNDVLDRKHTPDVRVNMRSKLRDPRSRCLTTFAGTSLVADEKIVGGDIVVGYKTVTVRSGFGTFWFSPELGCAELKSRVVHPSGEVIERTATAVIPGDPAPSMFDVARHYTEVPRERLAGR